MNKIELLRQSLMSRCAIDDEEWLTAVSLCQLIQFKKNNVITEEGKIEQYVYFIIEGMTRSYFLFQEKEVSLDFHFSGDFVSVYESFIDRKAAEHNIEALTDLSLIRIHYNDLQQLYQSTPKFEVLSRMVTEEQFKKSSQRVKDLLSLSASAYYQKLLEAHPQYITQLPLKYLASYLNITPESLSRIRKISGNNG